jgi:hypothetical protein
MSRARDLANFIAGNTTIIGDPTFTGTVTGAGDAAGLKLLNKVTIADATTASVTFDETYINSTYDNYFIQCVWKVGTDSTNLFARFLQSGGTEISDSFYHRFENGYNENFQTNQNHTRLSSPVGNSGVQEAGAYGQIYLSMKTSDSFEPTIMGIVMYSKTTSFMGQQLVGGRYRGSTSITGGIKLYTSQGNFGQGSEIKLYGMGQ